MYIWEAGHEASATSMPAVRADSSKAEQTVKPESKPEPKPDTPTVKPDDKPTIPTVKPPKDEPVKPECKPHS